MAPIWEMKIVMSDPRSGQLYNHIYVMTSQINQSANGEYLPMAIDTDAL